MAKVKQALGGRDEQLSFSTRISLFSSSTTLQSSATACVGPRSDERVEAWRQEAREATPEINFAESDRRNLDDEGLASRIKERSGNVVSVRSISAAELPSLPHAFTVNPPPYLVANETIDGRSLINSYMNHAALL